MRIGIFTESFEPLINGVSTSVKTLMAELERAGHTVFVITSQFPNYRDERPGIYRFPSVNSIIEPDYVLPVPISPRITSLIPKLHLDVIHSHSPFMLGVLALRMARRLSLPIISTNHTLYTEYTHYMPVLPTVVTKELAIRWMRKYYNDCDYILAPSRLTRDRLISECDVTTPISIVPTGIPAPPYLLTSAIDIKRNLDLPVESRILLYVGRLAPEKNLLMLLESFQKIAAVEKDTYLVIAGSGKSDSWMQDQARKLGVWERMRFAGFVPRTKLDPLYNAAEIFMFPSKTETQGVAIGEALASGTPCVVVNEGGAPESIRDGYDGILVNDDPNEMAQQALCLLQDAGLRRTMSENAKKRAKQNTPEAVARVIISIYEQAIEAFNSEAAMAAVGYRPRVLPIADVVNTTQEYEVPRDI